jgi:DNA-binding transcriptional regulator YdaS (Cro superfamily)
MVTIAGMKHRQLVKSAVALMGSQQALAEAIGLSQQGVSYLINQAPRVTAEVAIAIERATDGAVTARDLRPDIFASIQATRTT